MAASRGVAILLVLLTSTLAGCDLKNFYNQVGTFAIDLVPQGPTNSSLNDFRSLKVGVYGVSVHQILIFQTKEFTFGDSPKVVDFLQSALKGERIRLAEGTINLRAVDTVTLRLDIIEAIDAQGKSLPVCRDEGSVTSFPCFYMLPTGAYELKEPHFAPPRGGSVTFGYPLSVQSVTQNGNTEYFLVGNPAYATVETHR